MKHAPMRTGKAGEFRVASELMLRGVDVFMTINDVGTDIVTAAGCRVQVKSARTSSGRQIFTFQHEYSKKGARQAGFHKHNDIVVLWAIDQDKFFILPVKEVIGVQSISLTLGHTYNMKRPNRILKFENQWQHITKWRKP